MEALLQGSELPDAQKQAVAEKLHGYTGLPTDYWMRANLRVKGGEFSKELKLDSETTVGRLDTRYQGPNVDPLSESTEYDPQSDAITSGMAGGDQRLSAPGPEVRDGCHLLPERADGGRL